ncbi:hypothetical protein DXG01_016811 [Tephrocybe rancida]|nr:hypothetical protein DXG01_016811 [Tephrocybe rancida]
MLAMLISPEDELDPMSNLPPELLCAIFQWVMLSTTSDMSISYQKRMFSWVSVSHVCRWWRIAALACPELWTNIPFTHLDWATEMLARSKFAPLTVAVNFSFLAPEGAITCYRGNRVNLLMMTARQLSRIRELSIALNEHLIDSTAEVYEELMEILDAPAPFLERLAIHSATRITRVSGHLLASSKLIDLHLSGLILMDWPNLRTIVALRNLSISLDKSPPISAAQLMRALRAMPALECLKLVHALAPCSSKELLALDSVTLTHLRRLSLTDDSSNSIGLLTKLDYDYTKVEQIKIHVKSTTPSFESSHILWSFLGADDIHRMVVRSESWSVPRVQWWNVDGPTTFIREEVDGYPLESDAKVDITFDRDYKLGMDLVWGLIVSSRETLHFLSLPDASPARWTRWHELSQFRRLTYLSIGGHGDLAGFLETLSSPAIPFEALEVLTIHRYHFKHEGRIRSVVKHFRHQPQITFEKVLTKWLAAKKKARHRLAVFNLYYCWNLTSEVAKGFLHISTFAAMSGPYSYQPPSSPATYSGLQYQQTPYYVNTPRPTTPFIPDSAIYPSSPYSRPSSLNPSPSRGTVPLPDRYAFPSSGGAYDAGYDGPWESVRERRPSWHGDNITAWPGAPPPQSAPPYGSAASVTAGAGWHRRRHSFSAAGYSPPPFQIHPLLNAEMPNPDFFFNLAAPAFEPLVSDRRGHVAILPPEDLSSPVTYPPVTRIRIVCDTLPAEWHIDLELDEYEYTRTGYDPPPITVSDVLVALHRRMRMMISHADFARLSQPEEHEVSECAWGV